MLNMGVIDSMKVFERGEATEEQLIEETFGLIAQLDATEDETEARLLEVQIAERSDDLPDLSGFAVRAVGGDLLVVCLDEKQAQLVRQLLLLAPNGFVAVVEPLTTGIVNFVHPETSPLALVAILTHPEGEEGEED
jgi:hypothetical protein